MGGTRRWDSAWFKMQCIGAVPTYEIHNVGAVHTLKMQNVGTPTFYDIFSQLEF